MQNKKAKIEINNVTHRYVLWKLLKYMITQQLTGDDEAKNDG